MKQYHPAGLVKEQCRQIRAVCDADPRSYAQLLRDFYLEHKKYFLCGIFLCLFLCGLNCFGPDFVMAEEDTKTSVMNALTLGGSFGAMMGSIIKTGLFEGIDTSWTMTILALASLIAKITKATGLFGLEILNDYSFGIFESYVASIVMLVWFGVPLLLKSIRATSTLGISIEDTLRNWNGLLLAVVVISQMFTAMPAETSAQAAAFAAPSATAQGGIGKGLYIVICVFVFILTMLLYYLVRYLFSMIDIIMVPVHAFVPFASLLSVIGKFLLICFLFLLATVAPVLFLIVAGAIVLAAIFFFRTAYLATRYFKNIYTRPFFKKIFGGYDREIPLVAQKKVPKKIRKYLEGTDPELLIPVYLLKKMPSVEKMHKWERWWLVAKDGERFLCRARIGRECEEVPLYNPEEHKMFINRFLFYHEIFFLSGSEEGLTRVIRKIPKQFHIVFSKEYTHRYEEIVKILNFVELADYTKFMKDSRPRGEGFFAKWKAKKAVKQQENCL